MIDGTAIKGLISRLIVRNGSADPGSKSLYSGLPPTSIELGIFDLFTIPSN